MASSLILISVALAYCAYTGYAHSAEEENSISFLDGGKVAFCCHRLNGECKTYCNAIIKDIVAVPVTNGETYLERSMDNLGFCCSRQNGRCTMFCNANFKVEKSNLPALLDNAKDAYDVSPIIEHGEVGFCCRRQYGRCTWYCNMNIGEFETFENLKLENVRLNVAKVCDKRN